MRKVERIKIDSLEITVKELTVKEIIDISNISKFADSNDSFISFLNDNLSFALEGVTLEQMKEMPPSDIKLIFDKFKEVNAAFFEFAQQVGLQDLLRELKVAIQKDFLKYVAT